MKKRGRQRGEIDSEVLRLLTFNLHAAAAVEQKRAVGSDVEKRRKGVKSGGIERTERLDLTKIHGQLDFLEQNVWMQFMMHHEM